MRRLHQRIPEGMRDLLPGVCAVKRGVEQTLRALFCQYGYAEIETPSLENYALFQEGAAMIPAHQMWKVTGTNGDLLVMRPDNTTPTVRLATTKLAQAPLPLRLCYVQGRLEYPGAQGSRACESTQAGVEMLGEGSPEGDAEVIALAIDAMRRVGLDAFQIDLGQVAFFKGLMEEAGLGEAQAEQLRGYVEEKNMLAIELMLQGEAVSGAVAERLMRLPALYGGMEVLDTAQRLTRHPRCMEALRNLREILDVLTDYGLSQYVSIDLGMVNAINYYSGMIFRGITSHLGQPVLSGGRYDGLPAVFGKPMDATGFALSVDEMLIALERQGGAMETPAPDVLLGYAVGSRGEALAMAQALRAQGQSVAMCYLHSPQAVRDLRAAQAIARALFVDVRQQPTCREVE